MKLARITSRDNPLLGRLRKLARKPGDYRKSGEILLEGEHLCEAWLERAGATVPQAIVGARAWEEGRHTGLASRADAVAVVDDGLLRDIASLDAPAPLAFLVPLPAEPTLDVAAPSVVLDGIQDAGNVGSILRSAAAFGFRQVLALTGTASLWSPKVLRAGMGAHFSLRMLEGLDPGTLPSLTTRLHGTSVEASERALPDRIALPTSWAFGSEGSGLRSEVASACAELLHIEQPGGMESLNVAAAAAICLHAARDPGRPS